MSEYKKIENCKAELICTVDGETWKQAQDAAFKKLAKNVEVKGFRKGHVPTAIVKKYVNDQAVMYQAAEDAAQNALLAGLEEHGIELIDRPQLNIDKVDVNEVVYRFECPVKPDVVLGDYKSIEYKVEVEEATDEQIDSRINAMLERKADLEIKEDGTVENGDTVVLDFNGKVDGVEFAGGKSENFELVVGSGSFIPGFEDQLVGLKAEEEKTIEVTFPEEYHAEDLKGKNATFDVVVHEIKTKVLPVLNDEFVAELKLENVNTVEDLKNYVKNDVEEMNREQATNNATQELVDKLEASTEIDIPEVMIVDEANNMVNSYANNMMQQGIEFNQFLQLTGQTAEQLRDSLKDEAKKRVKVNLILEQIAKEENLLATDEDVQKEYDKMAEDYNMSVEEIKRYITPDQLKPQLSTQKALDFLKK